MRYALALLAALGLAAPTFVDAHAGGTSPGQAAKGGEDRNGDGKVNGKDYAPGQMAGEEGAEDVNGDGKVNGKDFAPGQSDDGDGEGEGDV